MQNWLRLVVWGALALASGCAMMPVAYEPPTTGPVAYFSVIDDTGAYARETLVATYRDAHNCTGRVWWRGPGVTSNLADFKAFEVGRPVAFSLHHLTDFDGASSEHCVPTFRFTPEEGRYYRATYVQTGDVCGIVLESSQTMGFEAAQAETFEALDYNRTAWDENSSFCGDRNPPRP